MTSLAIFGLLFVVCSAVSPCSKLDDVPAIQQGVLTPTNFTHGNHQDIESNCPGSYFQINIIDIEDFMIKNEFDVRVSEIGTGLRITRLTPKTVFNHTSGLKFASRTPGFAVDTNGISFPFKVQYVERKENSSIERVDFNDGYLEEVGIEPNLNLSRVFRGSRLVQGYRLSWDFSPRNSSRGSADFGYLAIRPGNGKINLLSSPSYKDLRLGVGTRMLGQDKNASNDGEFYYERSPVAIDLVTTRHVALDVATSHVTSLQEPVGKLKIEYTLGPKSDNVVTTTPEPETTTKDIKDSHVRIYFVGVNAGSAALQVLDYVIPEISKFVNASGCQMINSNVFNCDLDCHMSSDPMRGCVGIDVGTSDVSSDRKCHLTAADLRSKIESDFLDDWTNAFKAMRIVLDDCLATVEYQWYVTIAAFLAFALLAFVIGGLAKKSLRLNNKNNKEAKFLRVTDQPIHDKLDKSGFHHMKRS